MPDTKIAFQKQMCVKRRCETARCGEAARSGTTSTNRAEIRGGTHRGKGGGVKGVGGEERERKRTAAPRRCRTKPRTAHRGGQKGPERLNPRPHRQTNRAAAFGPCQ